MSASRPHPVPNTANGELPRKNGAGGQMHFDEVLGFAPPTTAVPPRREDTPSAVARRLKTVREAAGYETASAAAIAFGWAPSRYLAHESGDRPLQTKQASIYATAFGVDPSWLLSGRTEPAAATAVAPVQPASGDAPSEAMLRAARQALFSLAVARGIIPASVPADQALSLTEIWRELADAAVKAAWSARK